MADRFGSDQVERALAMQEGSVLANEVLRLRERDDAVTDLLDTWAVARKYADQYPIILVGALDALARVHGRT